MQKVTIPGGIAYYDPNYKNVRKVTGSIYGTWNENCTVYGLPENDTTQVRGFGGVTRYSQRFNLGAIGILYHNSMKYWKPIPLLYKDY